ncbi:hypothetical protein ACLKA6_014631 [Drosophila palustris]
MLESFQQWNELNWFAILRAVEAVQVCHIYRRAAAAPLLAKHFLQPKRMCPSAHSGIFQISIILLTARQLSNDLRN